MIPLSAPTIAGNEIDFLKKTIKKNWISTFGNYKIKFDRSLSKITKSNYVVSVSSGTAALHLALCALGIKKGEEVIVPSLTFVASVNVIKYLNSDPIFMDVDDSHNLDVKKTITFLKQNTFKKNKSTYNKKTKKKISAIIIAHMWGNALEFNELVKICKKMNIYIIEDAAEALGTYYLNGQNKKKHVGTIGDIGCLSFNGNKIITTGSGGALLVKKKSLQKKILYLAEQAKNDSIKYIHNEVGFNYRMPNLNAAFGYAQLKKLNDYILKRKKNFLIYKSLIKKITGLKLLEPMFYSKSNYWMNIMVIDKKIIKKTPLYFHQKLLKQNIESRLVWRPNHLQKMYKGNEKYKIDLSNKIYETCLCIPSSSNLKISEIKKICKIIKKIANNKF